MNSETKILTGAAYVRVSTDQQMELSPDSQLKEIKAYAVSHSMMIPEEFVFLEEEGRSGRRSVNRPQFQRMIGIAKTKPRPFDVILVWKFSRFARNQEESIVYKSMLRSKCGVDVVSVSEPLIDGPFGSLIERIIEWMDEYYSIRLSGEVLRGMKEKAQRGGVVGSPAYGYRAVNGKFEPVPEEAEIVRMVFEKFAAGGAGFHDLAAMLNALGVRTKKGRAIENRTVEYMLHNPVYIGKIRWSANGKLDRHYDKEDVILTDGGHAPIVSAEIFEQAQERLALRKSMYAKHAHETAANSEYMLRGLIRCSDCGSTLVYSRGGLQCHSYAKGACRVSHYIAIPQADRRVVDLLEECLGRENYPIEHRAVSPALNEQKALEARIQREQARLQRVKAAYQDGIDTLEEYRANKEKIARVIQMLEDQLARAPESSMQSFKDFAEAHKSAIDDLRNPAIPQQAKNLILRGFVDHIDFDRTKNGFAVFLMIR